MAAVERFRVRVVEEDDRTRLVVEGELDIATADDLLDAIAENVADKRALCLDLDGVSFMDSTGLRALIRAALAAEEEGRTLTICRMRPEVRRILEVTQLENRLPLED